MKTYQEIKIKALQMARERKRPEATLLAPGLVAECVFQILAIEIERLEKRIAELEEHGK